MGLRYLNKRQGRRRRRSEGDVYLQLLHLELWDLADKHVVEGNLFVIDLEVRDRLLHSRSVLLAILLAGLLVLLLWLSVVRGGSIRGLDRMQRTMDGMMFSSLLNSVVASSIPAVFTDLDLHDAGSAAAASGALVDDCVSRGRDEEKVVSSGARGEAPTITGEPAALGEGGQRLVLASLRLLLHVLPVLLRFLQLSDLLLG
mmetsp:Transcript_21492/g.71222  ORF Transcript_21492/g.71222 Transcript_21492/m.71222 type:complete len:201 (-) Transcript_21492:1095-1697(-)